MRFYYGIVACILTMFATACSKDDNGTAKEPTHTLLIYMAGDNTLSDYCSANIKLIKQGLLNSTEDINLVIYKDNHASGDALPELFQLKKGYDKKYKTAKIDTIYLQQYNIELDSSDPAVMSDIINYTFKKFNTEVKGFEMWSHGLSWIPSINYSSSSKPKTRTINYIGQDEFNYMELWEFRQALEKVPHLDYVLFDACYMGMAEVAYELEGECDYIYAPITEIMGAGFPYNTMIPLLANCTSKSSVESSLKNLVGDYMNYYSDNGTITLLKTSEASSFAKALAKLRNAVPEKLESLSSNAKSIENSFQHYGRRYVGARYYFYELNDYVDYLGKDASSEIQSILNDIRNNNMLISYGYSPTFDDGNEEIQLTGCKGIGISIPEFFSLAGSSTSKLNSCYGQTKWGKALGY